MYKINYLESYFQNINKLDKAIFLLEHTILS